MADQLRVASHSEIDVLLDIEDDAGHLYATVGLPADLPGLAHEEVRASIDAELLWVLADDNNRPIAFALCQRFPKHLHLRELDVAPRHMRRGLGRRLVEHVVERAYAESREGVTLTTFRDVPWNAPLYTRWEFVTLPPTQQPTWLAQIRAEEDRGPLARWPRIAMIRTIGAFDG